MSDTNAMTVKMKKATAYSTGGSTHFTGLAFFFFFFILADAFIQSDLQGCIHIFTFTLMAHCTSGAFRGSVSCSRTLRQGIELTTFCLLNDLFTSCTTVAPTSNLR